MVEALAQKAKKMGVVIRTSSPVKEIWKGKKALSGVVAEIDGNDRRGLRSRRDRQRGYANNPEWIEKYTGLELGKTVTAMGNTGKMGDGIRMAWAMGAAPEGMGVLHLIRVAPFGPGFPS